MEKEYFIQKDTEKAVLLQGLMKSFVKFRTEKFWARLYHASNQTSFCEGHEISCTKTMV